MVGTFIACLLSVIACFCKQTKTGEAKATGKQFAAAGAVVVVAAVCVGGFSLQSSSLPSNGDAEVAPDAAQTSADGPVMNYNDNEFTSKTLDDLVAIPQETWEAKEPNGEVAYFFEVSTPRASAPSWIRRVLICTATPTVRCGVPSAVPAPPWAATLSPCLRLLVQLR